MNSWWKGLSDKFIALSGREKGLIALCGLVVIVLSVSTLLLEPLWKALEAQKTQLSALVLNNQRHEGELLVIQAKLNKDPNQEVDIELKNLMQRSQELDMQLSEVVSNLISPSQMAALLESVLDTSSGIKLVSLESLTAEPIGGDAQNSAYSGYYVHPVRLELTGSYFAVVNYLNQLESLPVNYYWRSFHYQVENYPQARLILQVYTLGTRQEFIGG
ncbi:MSHA biogenesis protein MshJ [Vibrio navarrensis]|uniref:Type 4a pilus biogenesis protein PilO n=1 Tax=Vibrio navarrensis TaxID=29495 RepID=A0AAJ4IAT4_9VIBR|nr:MULTISPECIES: type 4a pilus biogenesis protein PilO [Vibrio]KJR23821.1 MSHA biogenesis protein MshJ [Vibrio sp. S234-5]MBE3653159.1 MSHA biogenesis protein MshJ [Vibrio navarrensis]MBE3661408.1 MSHA biogenesis protein MshJ [Vibrio navarrensis]MBE3670108.1 MSHA biogenesis protein MshJ [Vibrio navarrensis]MBE4592803.1 MSHA biogenesis protein MshJ [Vibrio navarrensis]